MPDRPATDILPEMRRSYVNDEGLNESDLAPTWLEQFERWFDEVVESGRLIEPNAMVFATADADGRPSARTVLLKGVDERGFVLYTNIESRKGRDALANPNAALVFDWVELGRQVVVTGTVERLPTRRRTPTSPAGRAGRRSARTPVSSRARSRAASSSRLRCSDAVRALPGRGPAPALLGRPARGARRGRVLERPPEPAARPAALPPHRRRGLGRGAARALT